MWYLKHLIFYLKKIYDMAKKEFQVTIHQYSVNRLQDRTEYS